MGQLLSSLVVSCYHSYKNTKGKSSVRGKKKLFTGLLKLSKTSSTMSVVLTSCACLYQVTGHSSATSVVSHSPRREICCDTSSCTQAKNPSNAPSVAMPAGDVMLSLVICALMLVRLPLPLVSSLFTHLPLLPRRDIANQKCFTDLEKKRKKNTLPPVLLMLVYIY